MAYSIYRKTTAKAWNWYQRWLWRNWTRISVWNIPSGKTGLPLQMFRCSWKFSAGTTKKVMFSLLSNQIFQNLFVNGKQPRCWTLSLLQFVRKVTQIVYWKIWSNDFKKSRRLLPSTLTYWPLQQTSEHAKPQRYISSNHWHMSYIFQNNFKRWTSGLDLSPRFKPFWRGVRGESFKKSPGGTPL